MRAVAVVAFALVAVCAFAGVVSAGNTYSPNWVSSSTYVPISGGTTAYFPSGSQSTNFLSLPFTFILYGASYSSVQISSNGWLNFGSSNAYNSYPSSIPSSYYTSYIAGFASSLDMSVNSAAASVSYVTSGSYPNRQWTVQWSNIGYSGCTDPSYTVTFQIVLFEGMFSSSGVSVNTGRFDVRYGAISYPCNSFNSYASIGVQSSSYYTYNAYMSNSAVSGLTGFASTTIQFFYNSVCSPNPCLNNGVCGVAYGGTATCTCAPGSSGTTCQYLSVYNVTALTSTPLVPTTWNYLYFSSSSSVSSSLSLPLSFWFYGVSYSTVVLSASGFLTFGTGYGYSSYAPYSLPVSGYNPLIAFWSGSLNPSGATYRYAQVYSSARRSWAFVVELVNVGYSSYPGYYATVQLQLWMADNSIEIFFQSVPTSNPSLLIGIQPDTLNPVRTSAYQAPLNGLSPTYVTGFSTGNAIRFSVAQNGQYMCGLSPCQNGATCIPVAPTSLYTTTGYGFTCLCPGNYAGNLCQTPIPDPCGSNPCVNGVCSAMKSYPTQTYGDVFFCQCFSGFQGATCAQSAYGSTGSSIAPYSVQQIPFAPTPIDSSAATLSFYGSGTSACNYLSLPFSFTFFGTSYTSLYVCPNGFVSVGTFPNSASISNSLPNVSPTSSSYNTATQFIALFGTSLNPTYYGSVKYETLYTSGGNRMFVIDFNAVPASSCGSYSYSNCVLTAHLALFEYDSHIEMHYAASPSSTWASYAVTGIEDSTGQIAAAYPFNYGAGAGLTPLTNTSYSWTPASNVCSINQCANGGTCNLSWNSGTSTYSYYCSCSYYFTGTNCQQSIYNSFSSFFYTPYSYATNSSFQGNVPFYTYSTYSPSAYIQIGFPFRFYGITYTQFRVCSNGYIVFDPTISSCSSIGTLPATYLGQSLLVFYGTDLQTPSYGSTNKWGYRTDPGTTSGNGMFTLFLTGVSTTNGYGSVTMRVLLFQSDYSIEFHYQSAISNGYSLTIGLQNGIPSYYGTSLYPLDWQSYQYNGVSAGYSGSYIFSYNAIRTTAVQYNSGGGSGNGNGSGLSGGAVAGIVIGTLVIFGVFIGLCVCVKRAGDRQNAARLAAMGGNRAPAVAVVGANAAAPYRPLPADAPSVAAAQMRPPVVGVVRNAAQPQQQQRYAAPANQPPAYNAYAAYQPQPQQYAGGAQMVASPYRGGEYMPPAAYAPPAPGGPAMAIAYNPQSMMQNQPPPPPFVASAGMVGGAAGAYPIQNAPPPSYDVVTGVAPPQQQQPPNNNQYNRL